MHLHQTSNMEITWQTQPHTRMPTQVVSDFPHIPLHMQILYEEIFSQISELRADRMILNHGHLILAICAKTFFFLHQISYKQT